MENQYAYAVGEVIGGRYTVRRQIGYGGMGEVYLAESIRENFPCALKTIRNTGTASAKQRAAFDREVGYWVDLGRHAHIVRCFHLEVLDQRPFMVLEYIAGDPAMGTDLRSQLRRWRFLRRGRWPTERALQIVLDLCHGLGHAHSQARPLIHCDLKPENILLLADGTAKITDFGVAALATEDIATPPGAHDAEAPAGRLRTMRLQRGGGTPGYMAPEQWLGQPVDPRTDIYALGCVLYELLSGERLFSEWDLERLRALHLTAPPPPLPTDLVGERDLTALLARCLAKEPAQRFATVGDLATAATSIFLRMYRQPPRPVPQSTEFTTIDFNNRGMTYDTLGRYDAALADYTEALRLDPALATIYYNRASTYDTLGRYDAALADYGEALRLDPTDATAYHNRGSTYNALGRYDAALADYGEALRLDPTGAFTYITRGNTYGIVGRYDAALADYWEALRLDPTDAAAYYNRGITYGMVGRYDAALADYTEALRLDPAYAAAYGNRGNTYHRLGRYDAALADYGEAIRLDPTDATAYHNRGLIYATLGRQDEALADYDRVLALQPENLAGLNGAGIAAHRAGRYREAEAYYRRGLAVDAEDRQLLYNLVFLLRLQGRETDALTFADRLVGIAPDDADAALLLAALLRGVREAGRARALCDQTRPQLPTDDWYARACLEGSAGEPDAALGYLARAADAPGWDPAWAWQDPDLHWLRAEPRFRAICGEPPASG